MYRRLRYDLAGMAGRKTSVSFDDEILEILARRAEEEGIDRRSHRAAAVSQLMVALRFGEVWNAPSGPVLPGGMLCLIVSADDYHRIRGQYIIVGSSANRYPVMPSSAISARSGSPSPGPRSRSDLAGSRRRRTIATLDPDTALRTADQIRAVLGP